MGAGNGSGQALTGGSAGAVLSSEINSQERRPCWVMGKATRVIAQSRAMVRFLGVSGPVACMDVFCAEPGRSRPWTKECRPLRKAYALRHWDKRSGSKMKGMSEEADEQCQRIGGGDRGAKGLGRAERSHGKPRHGGDAGPRRIGGWRLAAHGGTMTRDVPLVCPLGLKDRVDRAVPSKPVFCVRLDAGAGGVSCARPDLCGGRRVTGGPTAMKCCWV